MNIAEEKKKIKTDPGSWKDDTSETATGDGHRNQGNSLLIVILQYHLSLHL